MQKKRLSEQKNAALAAFKKGLLERFGRGFLELRLYGSRARGEGHEGSDMDVAVLVRIETGAARKEIYNSAAGIYMEYGVCATKKPCRAWHKILKEPLIYAVIPRSEATWQSLAA